VDPTHLTFQSNLTAIVGPNGCGKSNIVDAIHFVLGSSSKNLRAEQMADVIFNGTNSRKPVGQASIELIFDNNEGRLSGEYAKYPQISIRRELSRDGTSNYYVNGTRCRRKDITDIFLGTGLAGNNSYAIIEQGMISRLVEAKPEELRSHVEEAAGTSKYKERRRETENRIKQTRENLDRLTDLREEQAKQLSHLQRQANAAEKFKTLKADQRKSRAELQTLLWRDLNEQVTTANQKIVTQETSLEAKISDLRTLDKELEYQRSSRTEQNDAFNEIQSNYYQLGAEISRLEQTINHNKERKQQLESDYEQLENSYQEITEQQFEDQQQLEELTQAISGIEDSYAEAKEQASRIYEELKTAEQSSNHWQENWDDFQQHSANATKQLEVEKTKIQHLELKQTSINQRIEKIKVESNHQDSENEIQEIFSLKEQQQQCQIDLAVREEQIELIQENIQNQRASYQAKQQEVNQLTKELRDLQAKHASLQALQQIALGKSNSELKPWLEQNELGENRRLAEGIEVEPGFELAVETVLENHLDAICIEDFNAVVTALKQLQNAEVTFFNLQAGILSLHDQSKQLPRLLEKINSMWPVSNLIQDIYVAETLEEAMSNLHWLAENESIVTQEGFWVSKTWLRACKLAGEKTGVIQREHELKEIQIQIDDQRTFLHKQETYMQESQERLHSLTEEREVLLNQLQSVKAKNSDLLAKLNAKESYLKQLQQKQSLLKEELAENEEQLKSVLATLEEAKTNLEHFSKQSNEVEIKRQILLEERDKYREAVEALRQKAHSAKQTADELQVRTESMRSQVHYLNQNLTRLERQLSSLTQRREQMTDTMTTINDPLPELTTELQGYLEKRANSQEELTEARQMLGAIETKLKDLEKNRQQTESMIQELRSALEQMRLDCHALKIKMLTHEEQIQTAGFDLAELQTNLPPDVNAAAWEESLAKIDQRITRLGPINLAAIDEYKALAERKEYLDKQHADLIEALETLENAIRKIDKETRIRFKETYDQLNASFSTFFKQIFAGGQAYLELTSDDLLETGVIVKAQPPGKKNSTIHLLSGGEKALTAIALVFAIFSLNPAPFCVLDEVDAPLDDSNVLRFCNLVRSMAEKIQFIFVSHNKIAIEMGQQLAGVTMNEPGVSRLVSVDVEQAISMATVEQAN
jgi:chromosome segregation protein